MRLYLSSYQLGAHPEVLEQLVRGDRHGWVVANALDGLDVDRRRTDIERQIEALAALGLHAADLDLREHDPASIREVFGSLASSGCAEATSSPFGWRRNVRV